MALKGVLKLVYPIEHSQIEDFTGLEKIFHYQFYTNLRVDPSERDVAIVLPPLVPKANVEKLAELMFDTFNVQSLCFVVEPVGVSLYRGYLDSIVLHAGAGCSYVGIIRHGSLLRHIIKVMTYGFRDCAVYFDRLLKMKNIEMGDRDEAGRALLATGRVSRNFTTESFTPVLYMLPDGETITLNEEPYAAFEALFDPSIIGHEEPGICKALSQILLEHKDSLVPGMPAIAYGTCTTIPGFAERIKTDTGLEIIPQGDVKNPEWAGASFLIKKRYVKPVSKAKYKEIGPAVVDLLQWQ